MGEVVRFWISFTLKKLFVYKIKVAAGKILSQFIIFRFIIFGKFSIIFPIPFVFTFFFFLRAFNEIFRFFLS